MKILRQRGIPGVKTLFLSLAVLNLALSAAKPVRAQDSSEPHRKIVARVAPEIPSLARSMNIRGNVKVEAVVEANGTVKTAEVRGGHPLLVQSAVNAVTKWKWEPGAKETHELVLLQFNPQ